MNALDTIRIREEEEVAEQPEVVQVCEVAGAVAADPVGRKWRVRIFEYGLSKNRYPAPAGGAMGGQKLQLKWTEKAAQSAMALLEGARCFADHGKGGVRDLIGFFSNPAIGAKGPEADLTILESEEWAQKKLLAAHKIGRALGFSLDADIQFRVVKEGDAGALEVQALTNINSVDMVSRASSGGAPIKVLEEQVLEDENPGGEPAGQPSSAAQGSIDEKGEQNVEENKGKPTTPEQDGAGATAVAEALKPIQDDVQKLQQQIKEAQEKQAASASALLVREKLDASKLPAPARQLVESRYPAGTVATAEQIDADIKQVREAIAALTPNPTRISGTPARVVMESIDKLQIAMDRGLGVRSEMKVIREIGITENYRRLEEVKPYDGSVPGFKTISQAIQAFAEFEGNGRAMESLHDMEVREDWLSTTFSNALGSSIYRRLIQDYREVDYGLDMIIPAGAPHRIALKDFRTHEVARIGYMGDLSTHDPEVSEWPELAVPTDEKATIAAVQFGGLVSVSRKIIINDDLGVVAKIPLRLGRALRRTLAQRVWNLCLNNGAIYDSITLYHASSHGANLRTTALSATELDAIASVMFDQTEKDSGKKLGIMPYILAVPGALRGTAKAENMREFLDSSFTPNKVRHMFGDNGERIIVNPLFTDATDFYTFANPNEVQTFVLGFLQGREEPELFLADSELSGKAFTQDRIQYKVRHEYECTVEDYRGTVRNTVAG